MFVAHVRGSVDQANPGAVMRPSRSARTRSRLSFDELLSFAEFGADVLESGPIGPVVGGRVLRDDGTDQVTLGRSNREFRLQQASSLGLQPPDGGRRPGEI